MLVHLQRSHHIIFLKKIFLQVRVKPELTQPLRSLMSNVKFQMSNVIIEICAQVRVQPELTQPLRRILWQHSSARRCPVWIYLQHKQVIIMMTMMFTMMKVVKMMMWGIKTKIKMMTNCQKKVPNTLWQHSSARRRPVWIYLQHKQVHLSMINIEWGY